MYVYDQFLHCNLLYEHNRSSHLLVIYYQCFSFLKNCLYRFFFVFSQLKGIKIFYVPHYKASMKCTKIGFKKIKKKPDLHISDLDYIHFKNNQACVTNSRKLLKATVFLHQDRTMQMLMFLYQILLAFEAYIIPYSKRTSYVCTYEATYC